MKVSVGAAVEVTHALNVKEILWDPADNPVTVPKKVTLEFVITGVDVRGADPNPNALYTPPLQEEFAQPL